MKKHLFMIAVMLALGGCVIVLPGCTRVKVEKPDGTTVEVVTLGSSEVADMSYERDADGIVLMIGEAANAPEGIPEIIAPISTAVTTVAARLIIPDD